MTLSEMKAFNKQIGLRDFNDIKDAVDAFVKLKADCLCFVTGEDTLRDYNVLLDDLFQSNMTSRGIRPPLDDTLRDEISIAELSSLLQDSLIGISSNDRHGCDKYETYHLCWFQWFNSVISLNESNPVVHRFLSIQLNAYLDYIKSTFRTVTEEKRFLSSFYRNVSRAQIAITDCMTLSDFLYSIRVKSNGCWSVAVNIMDFKDMVLASLRLNEWLFYRSLSHLSNEKFDIRKILHHYRIETEERM